MARTYRVAAGRGDSLRDLWQNFCSLYMLALFSAFGSGAIGNGTTAGRLRTTASVTGRAAGVEVTKASTDDLWNLSAETATGASAYRAYWLYIDSSGTASFAAGSDGASAAAALAALPVPTDTKCILGVYVAGPSTDFTLALAAQGTIYNGIPAGAKIGTGVTHLAPVNLSVVRG